MIQNNNTLLCIFKYFTVIKNISKSRILKQGILNVDNYY